MVPKTKAARLLALLAVALTLVGVIGGWLLLRGDDAQPQNMTEQVSTTTFSQTVTASGTLRAKRSEDVTFEVAGTVAKVYVEVGDVVKKGQKLASIDDEHLEAELSAARSAASAARIALAEAGSDSLQAAARESALASAEADRDEAEDALAAAVLRAPFGATVTAVDLAVGDRVASSASAGASGSAGSAVGGMAGTSASTTAAAGAVQLATIKRFQADAEISATDIAQVETGMQVEMSVSGVSDTVYGTVVKVGKLASANSSGSAVFPVVVEVTGPRDDLYAGTSVDLSIIVAKRTDVLAVNTRAVQRDDEGTYVTVLDGGKQEWRSVEIGDTSGLSTEITSGLEAGETVLVPGFASGPGGGRNSSGGPGGDMPNLGDLPDFGSGGFPGGGNMPQPPAGFGGPGGNR